MVNINSGDLLRLCIRDVGGRCMSPKDCSADAAARLHALIGQAGDFALQHRSIRFNRLKLRSRRLQPISATKYVR